jgi:hypothetical protein
MTAPPLPALQSNHVGAGAPEAPVNSQDAGRKPAQLALCCGLVTLFWLIAASRWIFSDTVIPWDSKNQFYAFLRFLSAALHAGDWPFWNPYHYAGHPSVADPQSMIFSPLFVLWGALDPAPTMRTFDLVVLAHLLAGGLALAAIGWRARWPEPACVLAAALFMFGGAASGRLQHTGIILSYGLFPPALLLLQMALERRSHALAIGFAIVAAMMALGRSQLALLLCVLLLVVAAAEIMSVPRPASYLWKRSGVLATMAAVGGALLIVPLLLTLQFADISNRPAESLTDAAQGSLHPVNLATLLVPNIFGTHSSYFGPGRATLPEVALTDGSFNYLFVGAVPILLLLWVGIAGGGAWRRGRRLMTATLVIACLLMLGRYTPVYALAFRWVPAMDFFRRPTDAGFVFGIALAILSGHCLADYVREGPPRFRLRRFLVPAAALPAVIGSAVLFSTGTGHTATAASEAAISAAVMLVAVIILLGPRRRQTRAVAACLVTLIALAELVWWNTASKLNAEKRTLYAVLEAPAGADAAAIALLENALGQDHRHGNYPRVEVVGLGGPWQNLAVVRGWEATNGYNPLRIGLYDRLVAPGEESWKPEQRRFPPSFESYDSPLARALGLSYLVLGQPLERMPGMSKLPAADVLLAGPPIWIYRLRGAMPRARLLDQFEMAAADNPQPDGRRFTGPSADPVLMDPEALSRRLASLSKSESPDAVKVASLRLGRVEVAVASARGGLLTLHDIYYPGWVAEIDGKPASILRADVLFRGVEVPPGVHHVTFRFAPFSLANLRAARGGGANRP